MDDRRYPGPSDAGRASAPSTTPVCPLMCFRIDVVPCWGAAELEPHEGRTLTSPRIDGGGASPRTALLETTTCAVTRCPLRSTACPDSGVSSRWTVYVRSSSTTVDAGYVACTPDGTHCAFPGVRSLRDCKMRCVCLCVATQVLRQAPVLGRSSMYVPMFNNR